MNPQNECDEFAISIIDRICTPINEETKNNHELRMLGTIFQIMGIGIKDIMKDELYQNPENFLKKDISEDIRKDIIRFSKCIKYNKN